MKLFYLLCCLISFTAFAQPENPVIETINGSKFYVHTVQGGNTLYGISKLYAVSAEKIIEFNPTATNGIQIGQRILIPFEKEEVNKVEEEKVVKSPAIHLVEKGDNLYNISKRYNVSMEEIVKLNPGSEVAISLGQELKLPTKATVKVVENERPTTKVIFTDSIIEYTVLPQETLYSISKRFMVSIEEIQKLNDMRNDRVRKNDVIKIPIKKEKVTQVEVRKILEVKSRVIDDELVFKAKKEYKLVYLLPFNLDGGNASVKNIATEFYMGAQIAIDSLEKLGLNAKIYVLDVTSDTTKFKQVLKDNKVEAADLIIGPFMGDHIDIAARFAKENKIRMVSPLNSSTEILKENPFIYNAVNSDITLIEGAATYLAKSKLNEQIVLIKPDAKDDQLYQAFRLEFLNSLPINSKYKLIETNINDFPNFIKKGMNVIFVVPSRDKVFATKFMINLEKNSSKIGNGKVTVFGTKDWLNNDEIKGYYKNKYNLHVSSSYDFNYSYDQTKNLLRKYRLLYNSDLSKYGAQGFDVSLFFIQNLILKKENPTYVMNQFKIKNVALNSGFENKSCFILKFENYDLVQVQVINE